jgi:AraC-type DNA-binding domain-containing proteins
MEIETKIVRKDKVNPTMGSFIDMEYVIHVVEEGSLTYQNEEEIYEIASGDVILIPPKTLHAITNQKGIEMTVVHFVEHTKEIEAMRLGQVIRLPVQRFRSIVDLSRKLLEFWPSELKETRVVCNGLTQTIVGLYSVYAAESFRADGQLLNFKNWESIKLAIQFIQDNFMRAELSVREVCEQVGVSYNYFPVIFYKYTHETPLNYINRVRIDHAKTLLFMGAHNITETARASGFATIQHFSKVFKQSEGISPANWLKESFGI